MKATQVISLTLLSVLAASAQVIKLGKCPKPDVQANFDATRVNTTLFSYIFIALHRFHLQQNLVIILLKFNQSCNI